MTPTCILPARLAKFTGTGGIMRIPGRLRITWQDDSTLRIETDAGRQARLIRFNEQQAVRGAPTLQGNSIGSWQLRDDGAPVLRGPGSPGVGKKGSMKVVTTNLRAGYLRKNGIPYSENASVTEYFNRHDDFGSAWFTVTTVVDDPKYLLSPSVTTTHFKRETDQSKWNPQPCETMPPTLERAPKIPFPG